MAPTPATPQEAVRPLEVARPLPVGERPADADTALGQRTAPWLAAALSMGAYCLALTLYGSYPFGPRSRAVNDLGNQFVPFHARLWDLLHGTTSGDLFFNWSSGYGVPFLADFFTYLMNPFSWLVGLFPRPLADLPVFLVTLFSIGLGAALMTVFLGRLRPGSGVLRALLSVGYGLCAWVLNDGFADPMWMWGLVALPLTGIAADWCLRRTRWVAGTLLVALAWAGNFYTAAMATLAMALVLAVRLLTAAAMPWRARLRALARAASMALTGVLLAAPVLTVTLAASRAAQPAPAVSYDDRPSPLGQWAQLLPGGHPGTPVPNISIGVLGLLLVAAFPFVRAVPLRVRAGWCVLAAGVAASFVQEPTILLWHGFALPNGSPYRAAFVLSGILVMISWLALAHRPRPRELAAGAVAVALLAWLGRDQGALGTDTWILVAGGGVPAFLGLAALGRSRTARTRAAALAALTGTVLLGSAYTALSVTAARGAIAWFQPKITFSGPSLAAREGLLARADWPRSRTDPGPHEFANNDPLLIGGEGGSYYSSFAPAATARTLRGLGGGWYMRGRHTLSFEDPVGRALMGVGSYLSPVPEDRAVFTPHPALPAPLLTVRDTLPRPFGEETVFARQERVLGAAVYEVPALTPSAGEAPLRDRDGWLLPGARRAGAGAGGGGPKAAGAKGGGADSGVPDGDGAVGAGTTFTGRCTPGRTALWYAPWFSGEVSGLGGRTTGAGGRDVTANPLRVLGRVPADGTVAVRFTGRGRQHLPERAIGCLSGHRLTAAVHALRARGPAELTAAGHRLTARLRPGSRGSAVLALPAVPGWGCSVDGGPLHAPYAFGGLLAVPLGQGATRLSCSYLPPGLHTGLAAGGAAALALAGVAARGTTRGRWRLRLTTPRRTHHDKPTDL
ncbi:YfhO family protein [Streptomyces sp. DSM 41527]|uniref:YfhO family protein n=1 Tax=Streptomyces mooreae TaxID=3075523 RepID=A0ABU2TBJ7_9ACTN|nr:YfhO family protein [Streptomyces sp. DSM 41527]MDT0458318.1 YfhO family protein [Streptomyces sp. DSM 41527]